MSKLGINSQKEVIEKKFWKNLHDKIVNRAEEEKVEKMFWKAFNKNDLQNRAYLMKDPLVKKLYEKMHKNRIIRDYKT